MQNNNVIATEVAEKQRTSGKARFTAYMQGMKKLERKAQMQKEAMISRSARRGKRRISPVWTVCSGNARRPCADTCVKSTCS